jgi:tRNA(Arg) A34 adenosine deaminase TadA
MLTEPDAVHLRRTIALAGSARANGNHPFGALLVVGGQVVDEAENLVHTVGDITAHAELTLVRQLERAGRLADLATGTVFASCEPCPMCVGAFFWAGARHIVFGLSAARLNVIANPSGERFGFDIAAGEIGARATPPMMIDGPFLGDEAEIPHVGYW